MKLTIQLKDLIYWAAIGILLWIMFGKISPSNSAELERIKFQRDSLIQADIDKTELNAAKYHKFADSCKAFARTFVVADSINQFKNRHEKAKIKKLTPSQRDHVRDSIFRSEGIPNSPR